jgi:hypothetical protein
MPDERLLGYAADAKRAGATADAQTAMWLLDYRHEGRLRGRVALKLPSHLRHHRGVVADWVLERVYASALKLQLRGESVNEFAKFCNVAVERQVVSFWRSAQGKALERETALPSGPGDGNDGARDARGEELDVDALVRRIEYTDIVDCVLAQVNAEHVQILRRAIWDDRGSKDVALEFGTTASNVDQITSRFRREVRAECERRGVSWS